MTDDSNRCVCLIGLLACVFLSGCRTYFGYYSVPRVVDNLEPHRKVSESIDSYAITATEQEIAVTENKKEIYEKTVVTFDDRTHVYKKTTDMKQSLENPIIAVIYVGIVYPFEVIGSLFCVFGDWHLEKNKPNTLLLISYAPPFSWLWPYKTPPYLIRSSVPEIKEKESLERERRVCVYTNEVQQRLASGSIRLDMEGGSFDVDLSKRFNPLDYFTGQLLPKRDIPVVLTYKGFTSRAILNTGKLLENQELEIAERALKAGKSPLISRWTSLNTGGVILENGQERPVDIIGVSFWTSEDGGNWGGFVVDNVVDSVTKDKLPFRATIERESEGSGRLVLIVGDKHRLVPKGSLSSLTFCEDNARQ